MKIALNNEEITLERKMNIRELLLKREYDPDIIDNILVARKKLKKENIYDLTTSKGVMRVSSAIFLEEILTPPTPVDIRSTQGIYFGPLEKDILLNPKRKVRMKERDIFLLMEGLPYFSIALEDHTTYNAIKIGEIITGVNIPDTLSEKDVILKLTRVVGHDIERIELNEELNDGDEIYTELNIILDSSPISSEIIYGYLRYTKNLFSVQEATNTYIMGYPSTGSNVPIEESEVFRDEGEIFVRNAGERAGAIYIYRHKRFPSPHFNRAGKIKSGSELLKVAKEADKILLKVHPPSCFVIGLSQHEAEKYLEEIGVKQIRDGETSDNAIVVEQVPYYTLDIHEKREVKTTGIDKDELLLIELYTENAPDSVRYFKEASGLSFSPKIGKLKIEFNTGSFILFYMPENRKNILTENSVRPENTAGLVGITNSSRPQYGRIGIRIDPDQNFGPTGEEYSAANIVGRVIRGLENLKTAKKDEYVYFEIKGVH